MEAIWNFELFLITLAAHVSSFIMIRWMDDCLKMNVGFYSSLLSTSSKLDPVWMLLRCLWRKQAQGPAWDNAVEWGRCHRWCKNGCGTGCEDLVRALGKGEIRGEWGPVSFGKLIQTAVWLYKRLSLRRFWESWFGLSRFRAEEAAVPRLEGKGTACMLQA